MPRTQILSDNHLILQRTCKITWGFFCLFVLLDPDVNKQNGQDLKIPRKACGKSKVSPSLGASATSVPSHAGRSLKRASLVPPPPNSDAVGLRWAQQFDWDKHPQVILMQV